MKTIRADYPPVQDRVTRIVGLMAAALVIVLALTQLFGFENMETTLMTYWPVALAQAALPLAALVVVLEVFAVPYLLAMALSPLMRIVSAVCAQCVAIYVVVAAGYGLVDAPAGVSSGVLGSYVTLGGGWLVALAICLVLLIEIYTARSLKLLR